jgi:serine/threonine protein kinase
MFCKVLRSQEAAQREADILLALGHPNVVRCFGVDGSSCLLMEYLEGPSLHRLMYSLPKRRIDVNDALRTSMYVGAALGHVHDRGLLHLDVKPSNIVVAHGRAVLCDFGIARWQGATRPQIVTGTEGYLAPEECLREEITPAADVFGLGVTLYELLTGHMPFPESREDEPYPQVLQSPSLIRQHRATVPVGLEKLIQKCLSREPTARPNLAALMPSLHRYITRAPRMWPRGFHPEIRTEKTSADC